MGIEEEGVLSPREGFGTHVEILVVRGERDMAIVLSLEVFHVLCVFTLNLLDPEITRPNCVDQVSSCSIRDVDRIALARGNAKVEAKFTPEVGGVWREIG